MEVNGKVALVTGGASGLGAATARGLAARGARVVVLDRDAGKGERLAREIGGVFARCDVADEAEARAAIAYGRERFGAPSVLVTCAGIGGGARILGREGPMALADFERIVRVNLVGTFNMLRLVAAEMTEGGVIVTTASVAAFEGQVGQAAYAASKGGIVSLTLPAARELARFGIRVVTIAPGIFATPLLGELPEAVEAALAASIPHPARPGRPEEFAELVMAVIANDYLNGETIRLDGALRMAAR